MNPTIEESKGICQRCGEHIVFPASMQGENIPCPHCGKETTLIKSIAPELVRKSELENTGVRPLFLIYIVTILIPIIGVFLGIWLIGKKETQHGAAVLILSIVLMIIYGTAMAAMRSAQ